jgi:hypothetical protein
MPWVDEAASDDEKVRFVVGDAVYSRRGGSEIVRGVPAIRGGLKGGVDTGFTGARVSRC